MPTVIQCPACNRKLNVPEKLLGKRVKCPSCGEGFQASETAVQPEKPSKPGAASESVAATPKRPPAPKFEPVEDEPEYEEELEEKPRRRGRDAEDEEDRPRRRRRDADEDDEDDRPRRRRRRDEDEDEDDYAPRRRRAPHRGGLVLTLGIITLVAWCCPLAGLIVGGIAMNMAKQDLAQMSEGRMDASGRTLTMVGNVCAIIGVVLSLINFIAGVVLKVTNRI